MKKAIRKFLIAVLAAVGVAGVCSAAACAKESKYFVLDFEPAEGVEYVCEIPSGYEVKQGTEVSFSLDLADRVVGEPLVRANETELNADANGAYKFIMNEATSVTVSNTYLLHDYKVTFDKGASLVNFLGENGEELETLTADEGDVVKFKLKISVYHDREQNFDVHANSLVLNPVDGVYSFTVTSDTTVGIKGSAINGGLEIEPGLIDEEGNIKESLGGGTQDNPFLIYKPVDLYYMRELINNDFYSGAYGNAYYKLMADLDFEGEQIYVLGDGSVSGQLQMQSYFSGSFDGNGHTISNYYINETQMTSDGVRFITPYVGLFGLASASYERPVEIKNLTLKDFTLTVDGAQAGGFSFFAGGLVGRGMGVDITNCKVEGKITVIGAQASDTNVNVGYVGGVAGYLESVYLNEELKFNSSVVASGSDTSVEGQSGVVFAAGGLVGALNSNDDKANGYVLNSYAINNVSGAIYTGGLVGSLGAYSSVKNSYFAGKYVEAYSGVPNSPSYMAYAHAYGGGIAGYMNYDAVIADCYTTATVSASSSSGASFAHKGDIAGYLEENKGAYLVESGPSLILNSHFDTSGIFNKQYALSVLRWIESDWNFEGTYPVPSGEPKGDFILTVDYNGQSVNGKDTETYSLSGSRNMAQLYEDGALEQFVRNGYLRTYGYYFDKDCKDRVPFGYVPSGDINLYAKFVNYNEVAGRYYLAGGNGAYIDLGADGTLFYRNGALTHESYYYYDGTTVMLVENAAFEVVERQWLDQQNYIDNSIYFCAIATISQNGKLESINITDGYRASVGFAGNLVNGVVLDASHYYTADSKLNAVKEIDGFVYGTYYSGAVEYTFKPDGTGVYGTSPFNYTVEGDKIKTTIAGMSEGTIGEEGLVFSNATLTVYDAFRGVWENSASSHKQYTFDGKGGYVYEYYEYVNGADGKTSTVVLDSRTGNYTVTDGILTLDNGVTFTFDDDGLITVNFGTYEKPYSKQNSFAGEWRFFNTDEAIGLTLNGINRDGYGTGTVVYGADNYVSGIQYETYTLLSGWDGEANSTGILIYTDDSLIGNLIYNESDNTLSGEFFSLYYGYAIRGVIFCLYDDFRGKWVSSELGVVEFNGLGNYNLGGGNTSIIKTSGEVLINGSYAGEYVLDGYNLKGTFTDLVNGKTYAIEYVEATGLIKLTEIETETDFVLAELDGLYGATFVAANGDKYVFSGGGYLVGGGVLSKNGEAAYGYKVNAEGETEIYALSGGEKIGEWSIKNNRFVLSVEETEITLTYDNVFTGSWVVGGAQDGELVIGEIGADKTASGSYLGEDVAFSYDTEKKVISFSLQSGKTLYIASYTADGVTELKAGSGIGAADSVICVKAQYVTALKGEYTFEGGKKVYLDGMDKTTFGKGTAVLYDGDKAIEYTYTLEGANVILKDTKNKEEKKEQTYILKAEGSGYRLIIADALFGVRVTDAKKTASYKFDGMGTVTATSGTKESVYTYTIDEENKVEKKYILTLTDSDGKPYSAEVTLSNSRITIIENTTDENN